MKVLEQCIHRVDLTLRNRKAIRAPLQLCMQIKIQGIMTMIWLTTLSKMIIHRMEARLKNSKLKSKIKALKLEETQLSILRNNNRLRKDSHRQPLNNNNSTNTGRASNYISWMVSFSSVSTCTSQPLLFSL
jgi:hypothetical protein